MPDKEPLFANSRLVLSAGSLPNASFRSRVEAARQAGFDAISLFPQQYLQARRKEKLHLADMRDILSTQGISLDEVDPLLDWFDTSASPSENLIFEIATELGARSINAPVVFCPDISLEQLTGALQALAQRGAQAGLRIDLEFLPWCLVPDLRTALQVVKDTGKANVGVMLDFWHFFRGGDSLDTIKGLSPEDALRVTSIQVNDAPTTTQPLSWRNRVTMINLMLQELINGIRVSGASRFFKVTGAAKSHHPDASILMKEAISGRLLPGQGDMPVAALLMALHEAGVEPTVGLEIFSLDLARQSALTIAQQSISAYREVSA